MQISSPSPHIAVAQILDADGVDAILAEALNYKWNDATINHEDGNEHIRSGRTLGITPAEHNIGLYENIVARMNELNAAATHQDWVGFVEPLQLSRYVINDHYDWHFDGLGNGPRKLSLTIQLSDPTEYEGGDLMIGLPTTHIIAPKELGTAILFPSWMPHKVAPITSGMRYSLVVWGHGPAVR